MGGATLPCRIFVPCMGLICVFGFWMLISAADVKKTTIRPIHIHTYAFCLHWCTCQSVCALSCIMYARMRMLG